VTRNGERGRKQKKNQSKVLLWKASPPRRVYEEGEDDLLFNPSLYSGRYPKRGRGYGEATVAPEEESEVHPASLGKGGKSRRIGGNTAGWDETFSVGGSDNQTQPINRIKRV